MIKKHIIYEILLAILIFIGLYIFGAPNMLKATTLNDNQYSVIEYDINYSDYEENLLFMEDYKTGTINGITYTINKNNVILNGTATSTFELLRLPIVLTPGTYSCNYFNYNYGSNFQWGFYYNNNYITGLYTNNGTININSNVNLIGMAITNGTRFNNQEFNFMVVKGSQVPNEFKPFKFLGYNLTIYNIQSEPSNQVIITDEINNFDHIGTYISYNNSLYFPYICKFKLNDSNNIYSDCERFSINNSNYLNNDISINPYSYNLKFESIYVGNLYGYTFSDTNFFNQNVSGTNSSTSLIVDGASTDLLFNPYKGYEYSLNNLDLSFSASAIGNNVNGYVQNIPGTNNNNTYEKYKTCSAWYDFTCHASNSVTYVIYNMPILGPVFNFFESIILFLTSSIGIFSLFVGFGTIFSITIIVILILILKKMNGGSD